jgi:hypothetical protein
MNIRASAQCIYLLDSPLQGQQLSDEWNLGGLTESQNEIVKTVVIREQSDVSVSKFNVSTRNSQKGPPNTQTLPWSLSVNPAFTSTSFFLGEHKICERLDLFAVPIFH